MMIAIELSKQQALDADQKAIKQLNFTGNMGEEPMMFFLIEAVKEIILGFSQGTVGVL